MTLVDANLLLYAYDTSSARHAAARGWLEKVLSGVDPVGFSWATLLAFLRISTSPAVFQRPLSMIDARRIVGSWLDQPCVTLVEPTERHWEVLSDLLDRGQVRGALVSDADLAALSIEHGAVLATTDRDFARFEGLRTVDPLA